MMRSIEQCRELHRSRTVRILKDPAGMVIAGCSWSIMVVSLCALWLSISFWLGLFSFWGLLESVFVTASVGMCMWTHYMVMTTEPGFVPRRRSFSASKVDGATSRGLLSDGEDSDESGSDEEDMEISLEEFEDLEDDGSLLVFCDECNMYRPTSPWVNNCVGVGNLKYFLLFLLYVAFSSIHVIFLILLQRWTCSSGVAFCGFDTGQFPGRLGVWLLAASCVFGLFCVAMLSMEIYAIDDDPVYGNIAQKMNVRTGCKSSSRLEQHLSVIFGTNGFQLTWLLPLPERRNHQDWAIIGGFARRDDGAKLGVV